jgi:hypothetical protein
VSNFELVLMGTLDDAPMMGVNVAPEVGREIKDVLPAIRTHHLPCESRNLYVR